MKSHNEPALVLESFHKMIKTKFDTEVEVLCSNNRGKYLSNRMKTYLCYQHLFLINHMSSCAG